MDYSACPEIASNLDWDFKYPVVEFRGVTVLGQDEVV